MESGNERELNAQEHLATDDSQQKSSNDSVGGGNVSGTDVDAGLLLGNLKYPGSLTAADRPRPATGTSRGSKVGSQSYHFVG